MRVLTLTVGRMKTNCYLYASERSRECFIIDPGDDVDYIHRIISDEDLIPVMIIATHAHYDHIMGVNELKMAYQIPFALHKDDHKLLSWYRKSARHFGGVDPGPAPVVDITLMNDSPLKVGNYELKIIPTPGHTPGGICLYEAGEGILFSGDTIFAGGAVGRTDFPYCSTEDLMDSIEKLIMLPGDTLVYPGHGEATTIGEYQNLSGLP